MARSEGLETAGEWIESAALPRLVTMVARRCQIPSADLPDVLQETMIALWQLGLDEPVSVAWVTRVATNKAIDLLRRRSRARRCDRDAGYLGLRGNRDPEPEMLLYARMASLPGGTREFLRLHYLEGWSERELAQRLGMCRASIRLLDVRCRRAVG